ncbi:penicillin-binding transpeptidase domain-containing protein [Marinactinospora rubrisoli]|uniref:Penicillin-binding transpeptidase domain-containing protein n=1 Tax=Marinactinospora rubrisoli TaxID=2715399 RepID=A0ABW2KEY9_9ACTN
MDERWTPEPGETPPAPPDGPGHAARNSGQGSGDGGPDPAPHRYRYSLPQDVAPPLDPRLGGYPDAPRTGPHPGAGPARPPEPPADGPAAHAAHQGARPQSAQPGPAGDRQHTAPQPAVAPPPPPDAPPRRSRKGLVIGVTSAVVALALVGGGISWYVISRPKPEATASAFADAWNEADYAAMADLATGEGVADAYTQVAENLGVETAEITLGAVTADGDTATAPFDATLGLRNAGEWSYEGELPLERVDGEWKVAFSPAVIHPELGDGQTLVRTNEWGERGSILAADGTRLDTPDATGSIAMLTGGVSPATEEDLADLGPAYQVGDPVGRGGIQQAYDERLAGTPATSIRVADAAQDDAAGDDAEATEVGTIEGTPGEDVVTSIDPAVQAAAAQAIVNEDKPTAFVAVRPSTGEILAAANVPGGFNRAIDGRYPPGSAFKIISYEALFNAGMTTSDRMDCPKTAEVGGWPFKNAGDAEHGDQSVLEAFATSCNTALVQEVADRLDSASLTAAAEEFGMNAPLEIGIPSAEPSFPAPDSTTILAASSIGQGQILTSPLHMATVPAAVADGSWRSPVLVTEPEVADRPEPRPIQNAEALRTMMRAVVTDGTAEDAGFTGEVHGKTGTAEFGTAEEDEELPSHAWFVGFSGDLAFAVVVEGGGGGAKVAAPLAADFLGNL